MKLLINIRLIVISALFVGINCSSVLKSNGTAGKELSPQTLITYGRETNDSLNSIIGKVIENYHMCTAWSQWATCGATKADFFSTRTRTRHCGKDKSRNGMYTEVETGVCEGGFGKVCPTNYSMTENGFCIKIYTARKTHDKAKNMCKNDGGFLINIDSDSKYADVKAILKANDIQEDINIDGWRKNTASQWEYTHGSTKGYFQWYEYSGYPKNKTNYLYLFLTGYRTITSQRFLMFDNACSAMYAFLCEVPV